MRKEANQKSCFSIGIIPGYVANFNWIPALQSGPLHARPVAAVSAFAAGSPGLPPTQSTERGLARFCIFDIEAGLPQQNGTIGPTTHSALQSWRKPHGTTRRRFEWIGSD